ncbi:MAG: carboxypeptidase-like regulatory domain-containing protein, partial [Thermoplasmatota archaeon]
MRTILIFTILLLLLANPLYVDSISIDINSTVNDSEFHALLVAVAVYADDPNQNRPLMIDEVDDFYQMLLTSPQWNEENIKIIKGEEATVTNILEGLKWLDDQEDSNDMSLFYITTHGFPLGYDIPPLDETDGTDEAIMSFWGFAYPTNIIWDDEINYMLNRLESQGVCMIVDTCYAGGFNDPPNWGQGTKITQTFDITQSQINWIQGFGEEVSSQGRVVLMASREDEVSYSGGFAPFLIDAMKGYGDANSDGIISAEEAFYYSQPRAIRQHPTIFDNFEGEFPLINIPTKTGVNKECKQQTADEEKTSIIKETYFANQRVMGYITDATNGEPIVDATIEILSGDHWDGPRNTTTSDDTGFYSFNVEPGQKVVF